MTQRKRLIRRWWFWLVMCCVAAGTTGFLLTLAEESSFRKVKVGMTKEEVDNLVGDEFWATLVGDTGIWTRAGSSRWVETYRDDPRFWDHGRELLKVEFNLKGSKVVATSVSLDDLGPDKRSVFQRIQHEFRYQQRRLGW